MERTVEDMLDTDMFSFQQWGADFLQFLSCYLYLRELGVTIRTSLLSWKTFITNCSVSSSSEVYLWRGAKTESQFPSAFFLSSHGTMRLDKQPPN